MPLVLFDGDIEISLLQTYIILARKRGNEVTPSATLITFFSWLFVPSIGPLLILRPFTLTNELAIHSLQCARVDWKEASSGTDAAVASFRNSSSLFAAYSGVRSDELNLWYEW